MKPTHRMNFKRGLTKRVPKSDHHPAVDAAGALVRPPGPCCWAKRDGRCS